MCSVSFLPHTRGFYVGMNRDELLSRAAGLPPRVVSIGERVAIYPSEAEGGTWIGVNDAAMCVALLNWHPRRGVRLAAQPKMGGGAATHLDGRRAARPSLSRGTITPVLLGVRNIDEAQTALGAMRLDGMAAFRVIVMAMRERAIREWRWDTETLEEQAHPWAPRHWFSSGFDEPRAQHERGQIARAAWQEARAGSLPWLRWLHASHAPECGPFSVCMHRRDAATVSYTEVVVTRREATMRYHAGALCAVPRATATERISIGGFAAASDGRRDASRPPTNLSIPHRHLGPSL